jgi:hypothetical protein
MLTVTDRKTDRRKTQKFHFFKFFREFLREHIHFKLAAAGTVHRLRENKNSEKTHYMIKKYFVAPTMIK